MVKLCFFGGQNEIGGNKILLDDGQTKIFLDFGQSFSNEGKYFEAPFLSPQNIDDLRLVGAIPNVEGLYKNAGFLPQYDEKGFVGICGKGESKTVDAILISHAHLDHAGYLGVVRPDIKIYGSHITKRFLELRRDISEGWAIKYDLDSFVGLDEEQTFQIGSAQVTHIGVDHSIPGASAFIIKIGGLTIGYSGDLRLHGRRPELTENFVKIAQNAQLDYFLCEGTRISDGSVKQTGLDCATEDILEVDAERHSLSSEEEVASKLREILNKSNGLVVYDGSPADMDRVEMVIEIAREKGRRVLIDAKKAYIANGINALFGHYPSLEQFKDCMLLLGRKKEKTLKPKTSTRPQKVKDPERELQKDSLREAWDLCPDMYIEAFDDGRLPYERDIMSVFEGLPGSKKRIVWGPLREDIIKHQDEFLLYTSFGPLSLMHMGNKNNDKKLGGTYVYGKAEPFCEEMEISFNKLKNWIGLYGMNLEYAHTSGHANRADLDYIVNKIKPKYLIPIHTTKADDFCIFYTNVVKNKAFLELTPEGPKDM